MMNVSGDAVGSNSKGIPYSEYLSLLIYFYTCLYMSMYTTKTSKLTKRRKRSTKRRAEPSQVRSDTWTARRPIGRAAGQQGSKPASQS
eukprot:4534285-Heterocapsa_arctica.AAC.1